MICLRKLITGLALVVSLGSHAAQAEVILDASEAYARSQTGELLIIDIRHPSEWQQTGTPKTGLEISMHDPSGASAFLANILESVDGDKSAAIGLICASGVRSTWASGFLEAQGFTNIHNIREGMLGRGTSPGWIERGLPIDSFKSN